jgi:hypothetical protein
MKKYLLAAVTLAAFAGMSFAQAPAAPAKAEKPAAAKHAKVVVENFTGDISAVDAATNMITVKDAKGVEKQFTLEAAKMAGLAAGAKVKVTVRDGKASVKPIQKHEGKHEGKKAEGKKPEARKPEAAGK